MTQNCYDKHITVFCYGVTWAISITIKLYMHYISAYIVITEDVCSVTDGSGKYTITQMYTSTKV